MRTQDTWLCPSTLFCNHEIDFIIDQVSRQLSTAEPSVNIAHGTHDTHSVAVLNLSWQHSGKLLVFVNFCPSESKLPIEKRPRVTWIPAFNFNPSPEDFFLTINTMWVRHYLNMIIYIIIHISVDVETHDDWQLYTETRN